MGEKVREHTHDLETIWPVCSRLKTMQTVSAIPLEHGFP